MRFACLVSLLCLVGCHSSNNDGSHGCTADVKPAVRLNLTSAGSGQPLTGATATLTEGTFAETMKEPGAGQYLGALERQGTYDLTITATGFQPHTTKGIVVTHDGCHVRTQELNIALSPTDQPSGLLLIRFDGERHTIERARLRPVDR